MDTKKDFDELTGAGGIDTDDVAAIVEIDEEELPIEEGEIDPLAAEEENPNDEPSDEDEMFNHVLSELYDDRE